MGLPYWDWTKNSTVPDLWEDVYSPIKDYNHPDLKDLKVDFRKCQNKYPGNVLLRHKIEYYVMLKSTVSKSSLVKNPVRLSKEKSAVQIVRRISSNQFL